MTPSDFRRELTRIMPGYSWTVHKSSSDTYLKATGTQSSGSNRLSTLRVIRTERDGRASYEAKSAGYGLRAVFLHTNTDVTLARALRGLQEYYEHRASTYGAHGRTLEDARKAADPAPALMSSYERGQRDMLNLLLTPNKAAADAVAAIMDTDNATNPDGKLSFETVCWIAEIAAQIGLKPKDEVVTA